MGWTTRGLDSLGDAAAVLAALRPSQARDGAPFRLRFDHVNPAGALSMGVAAEDLIGRCLDEVAPELVGIGDWRHVVEVAVTGAADTWLSHHLGGWHELRCAPIVPPEDHPDDPEVLRYVVMASRPVTGLDLSVGEGQHLSRRGALLLQLSRRLGMAVTEEDVAAVIADLVAPAFGGDQGRLAIRRPDGRVRVLGRAAGSPLSPFEDRMLAADDEHPVMEVLRIGRATGPHTTGIALHAGSGVIGAVLIGDGQQAGQPAPGDAFVHTVATLVAQAVQRAGLYETQVNANLAMQHALLPPSVPEVPGLQAAVRYRPGSGDEVGGDWYDVVPLESGATAFVIGDVQGHDLAAAALMGQLRSVVRAYLLDEQPPTAVLSSANAFLLSLASDRIATTCIALAHPSARLVTVASAGHPVPVLVPRIGEAELLAVEVGPPLGVADDARCRERTTVLPQDAHLLLYTDGLVERRSRPYEEGEKLLVSGLTGHACDTPEQLADRALTLAGLSATSEGAEDDAALVAVQWVDPAAQELSQSRELPVSRESAVIARWFVGDVLQAWAVDEDPREIAVLLTDELVANAVRHAHRTIRLTVRVTDDAVRVEVFDDSHREPRLERSDQWSTSGRGLQLVDALSRAWGVVGADGDLGKTVWFELARSAG